MPTASRSTRSSRPGAPRPAGAACRSALRSPAAPTRRDLWCGPRLGAHERNGVAEDDAIVIGAAHNGLTAAAVMARDGMRVLVLEKNQYVGGMAATTELIRGYRYEIAGSVLFPVPDEIFDFLDLGSCPTLESDVMSVNVGEPGTPPMLFYADPEQLMNHLIETNGLEAVTGMAEVAAWCAAPARAIGRSDVRQPPKT